MHQCCLKLLEYNIKYMHPSFLDLHILDTLKSTKINEQEQGAMLHLGAS
jgi:hypothetical protein